MFDNRYLRLSQTSVYVSHDCLRKNKSLTLAMADMVKKKKITIYSMNIGEIMDLFSIILFYTFWGILFKLFSYYFILKMLQNLPSTLIGIQKKEKPSVSH